MRKQIERGVTHIPRMIARLMGGGNFVSLTATLSVFLTVADFVYLSLTRMIARLMGGGNFVSLTAHL